MVGIQDHEDPDIGGVMGRVKFEMKDTMLTEYAACLYPRENQEDRIFQIRKKRRKTVFVPVSYTHLTLPTICSV